jgi:hypothetical protein
VKKRELLNVEQNACNADIDCPPPFEQLMQEDAEPTPAALRRLRNITDDVRSAANPIHAGFHLWRDAVFFASKT